MQFSQQGLFKWKALLMWDLNTQARIPQSCVLQRFQDNAVCSPNEMFLSLFLFEVVIRENPPGFLWLRQHVQCGDLDYMLTSESIMQPVQTQQEGISSLVKCWSLCFQGIYIWNFVITSLIKMDKGTQICINGVR